ncbi:DUF1758 domain-containing protein [Trichonephila clavipes]|nr:DUF1758 domain-containing protein [Trichonephila clavipes]
MVSVEHIINIKFCVRLGKSATETYEMLKHVYNSDILSRTQAFEWHRCFRKGKESVEEDERSGKGLGIRDDPVLHETDQAIEIFKETVEFEKGRYIVQLPFRKSYNELSDNYPLAKQRFQNLWRRFGHDSELYQQYREIIRDYTEQGIIEEAKSEITDNELKRPVCYLPHQAVRKDGRLTLQLNSTAFSTLLERLRKRTTLNFS